MSPARVIKIAIALALIGAWLVLRHFQPAWANILFQPFVRMRDNLGWWVPAVGGALLGALLVSYLITLRPGRPRRPDDAVGLGCVMMAAWGLAAVLLVLGIAVVFQWHGIVNFISFLTMFLALLIMPQYYWAKYQDRRKKRHPPTAPPSTPHPAAQSDPDPKT